MSTRSSPLRTPPHRFILGASLVVALAVAGCSDSDDDDNGGGNTPAASTTYVGLMASTDGQTGPLDLTFASPVAAPPAHVAGTGPSFSAGAPVNVTGTFQLGGGAQVDVSGSLSEVGYVAMSNVDYFLSGNLEDGVITGGFTGPAGVSGSLVAAASSNGAPAHAFCGSFEGTNAGDPPSEDSGTFNLVVASGTATGVAYGEGEDAIPLSGTSTSSSVSINVTDAGTGGKITATGTYTATTISGSYEATLAGQTVSSGEFSGGICGLSPV